MNHLACRSFRARTQHLSCKGFSLQEMLLVIAIIGITTLIVLPAVSNLTKKAEDAADRRNAQHLTSVAAAGAAAGDPAFKSLKTKAAIVAYLASGGSLYSGQDVIAKVGLTGITKEEALTASRFLKIGPSGQLQYTSLAGSPITNSGEFPISNGGGSGGTGGSDGDGEPTEEEQESSQQAQWNAQLLEGASSLAVANGDAVLATAASKQMAISFLVDGGIGGPIVAGMGSEEQQAAASFLEFQQGGLLRYSSN